MEELGYVIDLTWRTAAYAVTGRQMEGNQAMTLLKQEFPTVYSLASALETARRHLWTIRSAIQANKAIGIATPILSLQVRDAILQKERIRRELVRTVEPLRVV